MFFKITAEIVSVLIICVVVYFVLYMLNHYPLNVLAAVSVIHLWLYSARLGPLPKRENDE